MSNSLQVVCMDFSGLPSSVLCLNLWLTLILLHLYGRLTFVLSYVITAGFG